jgi:hypothetical protein
LKERKVRIRERARRSPREKLVLNGENEANGLNHFSV